MAIYKTSGSAKRGAAKAARKIPASKTTAGKQASGQLKVQPVRNPKMSGAWQPNPSGGLRVRPLNNPAGQFTLNPQLHQSSLQMTTYGPLRLK